MFGFPNLTTPDFCQTPEASYVSQLLREMDAFDLCLEFLDIQAVTTTTFVPFGEETMSITITKAITYFLSLVKVTPS